MNSTLVSPVHGMGFVPGVVRGKLSRNPATNGVLLADHKILKGMSGTPAGCVLLGGAPFSHASIGLLSRGIPTVIVSTEEAGQLDEGLEVILDGASGRVRTESLLPDASAMPDQAFYAEAIEAVLEAAHPLPVTFRLLDLAADKHPSWASALPDTGPLGLHGSRLYLHPVVQTVVEAQFQALGLLSQRFSVGLLVPNMDTVEQFQHRRTSIYAALSDRGVQCWRPRARLWPWKDS